jgi:hypothetical protein
MCPGSFYPLYAGFIRQLSRPWARSPGIHKTSISCSFGCVVADASCLFAPRNLRVIPTSGVPRNFFRGGGGGVEHIKLRTSRTGKWVRQPPSPGLWTQL